MFGPKRPQSSSEPGIGVQVAAAAGQPPVDAQKPSTTITQQTQGGPAVAVGGNNSGPITIYPPPSGVLRLLKPAKSPDPPIPQSIADSLSGPPNPLKTKILNDLSPQSGNMKLYLGDSLGIGRGSRFVVIQIAGEDLLAFNRDQNGMSLDLRLFDADGKIIYGLDHNKLLPNNNNMWYAEVPATGHSILVHDQHAVTVLSVNYINKLAMRLSGQFHYAGHTVTVGEDGILMDTIKINSALISSPTGAMISIPKRP